MGDSATGESFFPVSMIGWSLKRKLCESGTPSSSGDCRARASSLHGFCCGWSFSFLKMLSAASRMAVLIEYVEEAGESGLKSKDSSMLDSVQAVESESLGASSVDDLRSTVVINGSFSDCSPASGK